MSLKNIKYGFFPVIIVIFLAIVLFSIPAEAGSGKAAFKYEGYVTGEVQEGRASLGFMEKVGIWKLSMGLSSKEPRERFYIHVFFSKDFTPRAGTFPITFSYLNKKDTCGGSFLFKTREKVRGKFSHDTEGQIVFESFSEIVKGKMSMKVQDGEGNSVQLSGEFQLENKSAFKE